MNEVPSLYERQHLPGTVFDDLNMNLVREHIQIAIERRGYNETKDPIEYLRQHMAVVEGTDGELLPTFAGMLAFSREPDRWLSSSGIDIAQFGSLQAHSTDLVFSKQLRGNLDSLVERTVELLWARSEHRYHLEGAERVEEHTYPLVVLRELTVNAIAHRDWEQAGSRVRIQMFPDRIEWLSPGGLPTGVTVETLRDEQVLRNPIIAQILYQAGKVETFGMGIDTVEDTLRAWGSRPLQVNDNGRRVLFCVYAKPFRVTESLPRTAISDRSSTILALIDQRGPLSISEIEELLNVSRRTVQYDLRKLVATGDLIVTGATNNRRYQRPK